MQGIPCGDHVAFPYDAMLFTRSPLLKELYCESHRHEPWLVRGDIERWGVYRFANVLYVDARARTRLLDEIAERLCAAPGLDRAVDARLGAAARTSLRSLYRVRAGARRRALVDGLLTSSARVLSVGVLKECLTPERVVALLEQIVPRARLFDDVLRLHQPLCMPHYLVVEVRTLEAAARYLRAAGPRRRARELGRAIDRAAHHSRFLLEPTELAEREAMRAHLEALIAGARGDPRRLERMRLDVIARDRRARQASLRAERDVLQRMAAAGRYTLHTRRVVMGILRMVQLIATWEELKHLYVMEAARALRTLLDERGLAVEHGTRAALLAALPEDDAGRPRRRRSARRPRRTVRRPPEPG